MTTEMTTKKIVKEVMNIVSIRPPFKQSKPSMKKWNEMLGMMGEAAAAVEAALAERGIRHGEKCAWWVDQIISQAQQAGSKKLVCAFVNGEGDSWYEVTPPSDLYLALNTPTPADEPTVGPSDDADEPAIAPTIADDDEEWEREALQATIARNKARLAEMQAADLAPTIAADDEDEPARAPIADADDDEEYEVGSPAWRAAMQRQEAEAHERRERVGLEQGEYYAARQAAAREAAMERFAALEEQQYRAYVRAARADADRLLGPKEWGGDA